MLPPLAEGDRPTLVALEPKGHQTQPPARYTEASLVKALEERGIGRPSTYASIIDTIEDRGYVFKKGSALVPSVTAFVVTQLLETHFGHLVDYEFTARMEDQLDQIASGDQEAIPYLRRFYHGNGEPGLYGMVHTGLEEIDAREVNAVPIGVTEDGVAIEARPGRYGPYLRAGDKTASIPEDLPLDELTVDKAVELLEAPSDDRALGVDPDTGKPVLIRKGRFGPYVQLGEADGEEKPKTASLLRSMTPESVTLEDALRLLTLPRVIGEHPDGGPVTARLGRYGPYLSWGEENRTLEHEEQLFTLTLDEAIEVLKQPRRRRGQRAPAAPLKELGPDPVSGGPIVVKDGRYGPYVTDGETNASLKRDDDVASLTLARAAELLQARREAGPAKRTRARAKSGAKKTTAKSTAKTKRTAAKKTGAKKPAPKKRAAKETTSDAEVPAPEQPPA
jgi:DNA topoisomerase-1